MPAIPDGLPSIGKATKILLESHGIETAFDVWKAGESGHENISGLGPAKWAVLWMWSGKHLDASEILLVMRERLGDAAARSNVDHHYYSENNYKEIAALIMHSKALDPIERQQLDGQLNQWMATARPRIAVGKTEAAEQWARWVAEREQDNKKHWLIFLGFYIALPLVVFAGILVLAFSI